MYTLKLNEENPVVKVFKKQSHYVQCQAFTNDLENNKVLLQKNHCAIFKIQAGNTNFQNSNCMSTKPSGFCALFRGDGRTQHGDAGRLAAGGVSTAWLKRR